MKQAQWISPFSMKDHSIGETLFCSLWQFDLDKGPCVHNADPDLLSMFPRRKFVSMTTDLCILRCSRKILCESFNNFFILQKSVFSVLLLVLDSYDIQPFKGSNRTVDGSLAARVWTKDNKQLSACNEYILMVWNFKISQFNKDFDSVFNSLSEIKLNLHVYQNWTNIEFEIQKHPL